MDHKSSSQISRSRTVTRNTNRNRSFRVSRFVSPRGEAGGYTVYKEGGPGYTRYIVYTDTRDTGTRRHVARDTGA